jgi:predicted nuclease of predicted toxin-antitoxin system
MIKFLADENFNADILRGLLRQKSDLDIECIQDVGLSGADDSTVLDFAARDNRVLLTHDVNTITKYAYARLAAGEKMSGVIEVSRAVSISTAIRDILLVAECGLEKDFDGQIVYLPLK